MPKRAASACLLAVAMACGSIAPALAVPPPPPLAEQMIEPVPNGPELVLRGTVRAYQAVPFSLAAQAGDQLLLRLQDGAQVLVLQLDAPSGLPWISGAVPGRDGLELRLAETGQVRLLVLMSGDAARVGRAASFELGLRLRR